MKLLALLLIAVGALAESPFRFTAVTPESLALTEHGKTVFVYNNGIMRKEGVPADRYRCCYVHPVLAPNGVVVTDDFPADHYHHRGIFWAWPVVNIGGKRHDLWLMTDMGKRFRRWVSRETTTDRALLSVENGWYVGDREVVREVVVMVAHPTAGQSREIDFDLTFEATDRPVELLGDPTNNKGYGGFCARFAPRTETVITTDEGREAKDSNMVPHPWAREDGSFKGGRAGLRIDIDPSNPGYPNGWCLRHYGFLGVNYPGNTPVTLAPGKPLRLKYTVTVYAID